MRSIDADPLKESIDKFIGYLDEDMIYRIKVIIDNAPTIPDFKEGYKQAIKDGKTNFSRPQGEWIKLRDYDFKCSLCGESMMDKYNFCPECGAKMKGGAEE